MVGLIVGIAVTVAVTLAVPSIRSVGVGVDVGVGVGVGVDIAFGTEDLFIEIRGVSKGSSHRKQISFIL